MPKTKVVKVDGKAVRVDMATYRAMNSLKRTARVRLKERLRELAKKRKVKKR
tara:strand:+ start:1273 stop:1428 length:156 start_codon:yes stop_codon:yes gene_type:complete